MLFWFVGTALAAMWVTFRDPAIDHRYVVAGALLPDAVDLLVAGAISLGPRPFEATAGVMHSLAAPVVLLLLVMLVTVGRRRARRLWLALPIGVFWHLVFDAAWSEANVFGWPFADPGGLHTYELFVFARPLWVNLLLEVVGVVVLVFLWRRWPERRLAAAGAGA